MEKIKIVKVVKTCEACPSQWDAWASDNRYIYVRYRWGYLSVSMAAENDCSKYAAARGEKIFGKQLGDDLDGVLDYDTLKNVTGEIIKWPQKDESFMEYD